MPRAQAVDYFPGKNNTSPKRCALQHAGYQNYTKTGWYWVMLYQRAEMHLKNLNPARTDSPNQPQSCTRAQTCWLPDAESWLSSQWPPWLEEPGSTPAQCWPCPSPAMGLLQCLGRTEGNSSGQPSTATQTSPGLPGSLEAWPTSPTTQASPRSHVHTSQNQC